MSIYWNKWSFCFPTRFLYLRAICPPTYFELSHFSTTLPLIWVSCFMKNHLLFLVGLISLESFCSFALLPHSLKCFLLFKKKQKKFRSSADKLWTLITQLFFYFLCWWHSAKSVFYLISYIILKCIYFRIGNHAFSFTLLKGIIGLLLEHIFKIVLIFIHQKLRWWVP